MVRQWLISSTVADIYAEPSEKAERVTQYLFLTPCLELSARKKWRKICGPDNYIGWVKASQANLKEWLPPNWKVSVPFAEVKEETGQPLGLLSLDTRVSGLCKNGKQVIIEWPEGRKGILPRRLVKPVEWVGTFADLVELAQKLIGIPYLWGGTASFGFDCSGLVQRLFHFIFNLWLPRDSHEQQKCGMKIRRISKLEPGDLVFFPKHVGIWLGNGRIIHSSARAGQVIITDLSCATDPYAKRLRETFIHGCRVQPSL